MGTRQKKAARKSATDPAQTVNAAADTPAPAAAPKRRRGPRAGTESARRGGMAVREKYGQEFFAQIGSKGGKSVSARRGSDFYSGIGQKGGARTRERLGIEHYERIGRMGGLRQRQRERLAAQQEAEGQSSQP